MKSKDKKLLLVITLLVITIGFALLSTTLSINGTAGINKNTWDIHWDETSIEETTGSVTATTPAYVSDTKKEIVTFAVELELPGDFYEFTVDAKNYGTITGTIDDVKVKIYEGDSTTPLELENIPEYLIYSFTHADGTEVQNGEKITPNESIKYKFKIGIDEDYEKVPESDSNPDPDPIPFRVEVEESVVQTTTQPTSNEVYAFFKDNKYYGDEGSTLTDYTTDYTTLKDSQGYQRRAFLKLTLVDDVIKKASACGILNNGTMICLDPEVSQEEYTAKANQLIGHYGQYNSSTYTGCDVVEPNENLLCEGSIYQRLSVGHAGATNLYNNQCNQILGQCPGFIDYIDFHYIINRSVDITTSYDSTSNTTSSSCTVRVSNHLVRCS